ncbi:hypothetical protein PS862_02031 [Pseudomonas fluorescens]|uniref:Uncharacterized protein n=1 Tax=Pseudomonas fluorescens TaxID=294 RepID=A0A5E6QF72_PSEFL|nr:hypothetical protein PS639_00929 [Pseudomonas fluorescens]VVO84963.1 hypothetical protein PS862_02031 [Pseudomonas fluorescens]
MPLARTGIGKALMLDDRQEEWQRLYEVSLPAGGKNQFWPQHPEQSWEQVEPRMLEYVAGGYAFDLEDNEPSIRCVERLLRCWWPKGWAWHRWRIGWGIRARRSSVASTSATSSAVPATNAPPDPPQIPCGSGLARESGVSVNINVG